MKWKDERANVLTKYNRVHFDKKEKRKFFPGFVFVVAFVTIEFRFEYPWSRVTKVTVVEVCV